MSEQTVLLAVRADAPDPYDHALGELRGVLGDATVGDPDDAGVLEVRLEAADEQEAIKRVIDAIAAAGADDHFEIAEHP
jgi:hypothetical protein